MNTPPLSSPRDDAGIAVGTPSVELASQRVELLLDNFSRKDREHLKKLFRQLSELSADVLKIIVDMSAKKLAEVNVAQMMRSSPSASSSYTSSPQSLPEKPDSPDFYRATGRVTPIAAEILREPAQLEFKLEKINYRILSAFFRMLTKDMPEVSFEVSRCLSENTIIVKDACGVPYGEGVRQCLEGMKKHPANVPFLNVSILEERFLKGLIRDSTYG